MLVRDAFNHVASNCGVADAAYAPGQQEKQNEINWWKF
jgi:hypothetical protein